MSPIRRAQTTLVLAMASALAAAAEPAPTLAEILQQRAVTLAKEAGEHRKAGRLLDARARLAALFLLQTSAAGKDLRIGVPPAKVLQMIADTNQALAAAWTKEFPALDTRLDLVIRDQPLPGALKAVAQAAGVTIELTPGSVEDAADLANVPELRVTWLDLRNAKLSEALEWLVRPAKLDWRLEKDRLVVLSERRGATACAWVYDVSPLVSPVVGEDGAWDPPAFIRAVRKELGLATEDMLWKAPGQLLVWGDGRVHSAVAGVVAALANPQGTVALALKPLHEVTAKRAEKNQALLARSIDAQARARVSQALEAQTWSLLSAALGGELNQEALTELQVAWRSPALPDALKANPLPGLRSAWLIAESARALPKNLELSALAAAVRPLAAAVPRESFATANDCSPALLYAALLLPDDKEIRERAQALLSADGSAFAKAAAVLLIPGANKLTAALVRESTAQLTGPDQVFLFALACRSSGQDTWNAFRDEARHILGRQPLPGSVVVLVNRLSQPRQQR